MNKRSAIIIIYWVLVSMVISTLLKPSFTDFWISWFIALLITPGSIILLYGYRFIKSNKGLRFILRFFLLLLIPVLWSYLTIIFAFWYIVQIHQVYIPMILVNPLLLGIVLGFFAIIYYFLDQKFKIESSGEVKTISIFSDRKRTNIIVDDVTFIESCSDHTIVHLKDKTSYRNTVSISSWNESLPAFLRVHRSFLVNPKYCAKKGADIIIGKDIKLPISRTYRNRINEFYAKETKRD